MKSILKLLIILLVSYDTVSGQDLEKKVSISYTDASLEIVLAELSRRYELKFSYSKDLVELTKKITLVIERGSIRQVLEGISDQADIQYQLIGHQIVLKRKSKPDEMIQVKGKVIDNATNVPLAFASVRLDRAPLGTATNTAGEFIFNIPREHLDEKITISFVGYKSYHFSIPDKKMEMVVPLEEDLKELNTVVVTSKTGLSILEEAISRIKQNYDTGAVIYSYFIKDVGRQNDEAIGASETLYQAYRGASTIPQIKQIKPVMGRRAKDFSSLQKILGTFIRWTGFELGVDLDIIFFADLSTQRKDDEFPSPKFLRQHQFELLGTSVLDDKEVYVITFDQKDLYRNKSLYKGKLYIDTETLAFTRIETELSPKGIGRAKFFGTSKAIALLFGYSKCAVLAERSITNYKILNGKWYVSSVEIFWEAGLAKPKSDFFSELNVQSELVVTNIQTNDIKPFNSSEILTSKDRRDWNYMYTLDFWEGYNAIPTDRDLADAFQFIQRRNQTSGFDKNFWKRYQPYKSNPALLTRDSALCLQTPGTIINDQTKLSSLSKDTGNRLFEPKYPPLSRTLSTDHFVFHYVSQDSSSAQEISVVLENNYERVLSDFGLKGLNDPIHVEIYPNIENYHFAIGNPEAPDSDAGMAVDNSVFKMVSPGNPGSYHTRGSMLKAAVHEFAHCVHYNFIERLEDEEQTKIGNEKEAPWLFEALACYEANQFYNPAKFEYLTNGDYPSIQELNEVEQNGKIYDIGFVLIQFIQVIWGKEGVLNLVRQNGNIAAAFAINETEFEKQFFAYLKKEYMLLKN